MISPTNKHAAACFFFSLSFVKFHHRSLVYSGWLIFNYFWLLQIISYFITVLIGYNGSKILAVFLDPLVYCWFYCIFYVNFLLAIHDNSCCLTLHMLIYFSCLSHLPEPPYTLNSNFDSDHCCIVFSVIKILWTFIHCKHVCFRFLVDSLYQGYFRIFISNVLKFTVNFFCIYWDSCIPVTVTPS